jgi:hypothetical protein
MRMIPALLLLASLAGADTVLLKNGLSVHGRAVRDGDSVVVTARGRTWRIDSAKVKEIQKGESPREQYARRAQELGSTDAAGWYRLALWAEQNKLPQAKAAYRRVLGIDADHRAARRELGFEKVGGEWVAGDDAKRSKGFVLCAGKWMLPEEADQLMRKGLMSQAKATEAHRVRAKKIVAALLDDDPEIREIAANQLSELPDAALVRPLEKALFAPDPEVRILAVKTLSRIGDRVALPWLIRSSMYDAKKKVRDAAFRSVKSFRDEDVFFPYARVLFSKNPKASIAAAKALADLDDLRGVDLILRRISIGLGASPRVNIMVGTQSSYIQDFDVEIAQAAAIGDPIVGTIRDGIILDFKILGGWGESWVVQQRSAYAGALASLTGRDFGENWKQYAKYAKEQELPRVRLQ